MFEDGVSLWILVVYSISFRIDGLGFFMGRLLMEKKKTLKISLERHRSNLEKEFLFLKSDILLDIRIAM